jgi:hypothetical protein
VYGTCRPELLGQGLPLDTGTQDIEDCFKYPAGIHGVAASAGFSPERFCCIPFFPGYQGFHQVPELVGYFPRIFLFHISSRFLEIW